MFSEKFISKNVNSIHKFIRMSIEAKPLQLWKYRKGFNEGDWIWIEEERIHKKNLTIIDHEIRTI